VGKPFERQVSGQGARGDGGKLLKSGEEEIEVGGKKLTCSGRNRKNPRQREDRHRQVLDLDDIPGMAARIEIAEASDGVGVGEEVGAVLGAAPKL